MSHSAMRALCLLAVTAFLVGRPTDARAVLMRGDVSGVITRTGLVPPGFFGLEVSPTDPYVNNGLPIAVRFWLDTDLVPVDQNPTASLY